jgi:hypothetical protein
MQALTGARRSKPAAARDGDPVGRIGGTNGRRHRGLRGERQRSRLAIGDALPGNIGICCRAPATQAVADYQCERE